MSATPILATTVTRTVDGVPTMPRDLAMDPRFLDAETRGALYPPLRDRLGKLGADRLWFDAKQLAGIR